MEADINIEHLEMLKSILEGDKFSALVDLYIKDSTRLINECRQALQNEQWQHLSEVAHALKGSSANVGITVISNIAKQLEGSAKDNDRLACLSLIGSMVEKQNDVISTLNTLR